jgi:CheY-like chemotaxis protein
MASPRDLPTVSVLVVDDDTEIREIVTEVLEDEGYSVAAAIHGAAALAVLKTVRPAVILLDLNMPVMNGPEFREAQLRDPDLRTIPTVVMSAVDRMREQIATMSVDDALPKPVRLPQLLAVVQKYSAPRGAPGPRAPQP